MEVPDEMELEFIQLVIWIITTGHGSPGKSVHFLLSGLFCCLGFSGVFVCCLGGWVCLFFAV